MSDDIKPCCNNDGRSPFNGDRCPYESDKSKCPVRSYSIERCKGVKCRALYGYGGLKQKKKLVVTIDNPSCCPNRYVQTNNCITITQNVKNGICGITKELCNSESEFPKGCPLEDVK